MIIFIQHKIVKIRVGPCSNTLNFEDPLKYFAVSNTGCNCFCCSRIDFEPIINFNNTGLHRNELHKKIINDNINSIKDIDLQNDSIFEQYLINLSQLPLTSSNFICLLVSSTPLNNPHHAKAVMVLQRFTLKK